MQILSFKDKITTPFTLCHKGTAPVLIVKQGFVAL